MSLNPAVQFDETSLTAAEFDPQDKVLPNSPVESNDVNAIVLRALRRAAYLKDNTLTFQRTQKNLLATGYGGSSIEQFTTIASTTSSVVYVDLADASIGDKIKASVNFDYTVSNVAGDFGLNLASIEDYGGAATTTLIPGTQFYTRYAGSGERRQVSLQGSMTISTAGPLRVALRGTCPTNADTLFNFGTGCLIVERVHLGL